VAVWPIEVCKNPVVVVVRVDGPAEEMMAEEDLGGTVGGGAGDMMTVDGNGSCSGTPKSGLGLSMEEGEGVATNSEV
jgi:hypothetical protein